MRRTTITTALQDIYLPSPIIPVVIKYDYYLNLNITATLKDHTDEIRDIVVLPDNRIASGSLSGNVLIHDVVNDLYTVLPGNTSIMHVRLLSDGRIVTSRDDTSLQIWKNDILERTINNLNNDGWSPVVIVLPDNTIITTNSEENGDVELWDLNTGEHIMSLKGHTQEVAFAILLPDGRLVTGSSDTSIRIWDLKEGVCEKILTGHTKFISDLVLLSKNTFVSVSQDGTLRIWNADTGVCDNILSIEGGYPMTHVRVVPGGNRLISADKNGSIIIWTLRPSRITYQVLYAGQGHRINNMDFLPNNQLMSISQNEDVKIWDLDKLLLFKTLDIDWQCSSYITPWGDKLIIDGENELLIIE